MITLFAVAAILQAPGAWVVLDQQSRLDGAISYVAGVDSTEPILNSIGRPQKANLSVSCIEGERRVIITWPTYLGRDEANVSWKFDDGPVRSSVVTVLDGGRYAMIRGRQGDDFMDQIVASSELVVAVSAHRDRQEAVFALAGGAETVASVRRACPGR